MSNKLDIEKTVLFNVNLFSNLVFWTEFVFYELNMWNAVSLLPPWALHYPFIRVGRLLTPLF